MLVVFCVISATEWPEGSHLLAPASPLAGLRGDVGADVVAKFLAYQILNENPIGAESGSHGDFQSAGCVGHLIG